MSTIALSTGGRRQGSPTGRTDPRSAALCSPVLAFAESLLAEQKVPSLARRGASRALALLLARSARGPVVLSAEEGARLCGFEPRTWWLVKRRLLELGHLVASTGGGPPSGRPGGRGHKGAYFVAPETLARFRAASTAEPRQTVMGLEETLNAPPETLNAPSEERNLSHHRPERTTPSLRLLEKKRTSDVSSFEGDESERPTVEAVWAWIRRECSTRLKLGLLRLLETLLVTEASSKTVMAPQETVMAPQETVMPEKGLARDRRPRSPTPLWSGEKGEEAQVLSQVRSILTWANREHRASFPVEKSAQDTLLYPFERVRAAVANVLLKRARGYRFENAGAVLWDGITLEGYKLDEFSVASFEEVLARLGRTSAPSERKAPFPPPQPRPAEARLEFEPERRRRELLQALYERLPTAERADLDRRAEVLAREELGETSTLRLGLRRLDKRNELLAARGDAEAIADANVSKTAPQESQI
jgi:hypothetical protein